MLFKRKGISTNSSSSNSLFAPGVKLVVKRAPLFPTSIQNTKFQRPMQKRRAYDKRADEALRTSSLGPKRRMNGMARLLARAGKGLTFAPLQKQQQCDDDDDTESSDDSEAEEDRPFEPLCVWKSPHINRKTDNNEVEDSTNNSNNNNNEEETVTVPPRGLPPTEQQVTRTDEFGLEETVTVLQPAPVSAYARQDVFVPPILAKWLRPHQREGVAFLYECVMGLRGYPGNGCILADDMGLGKTLQSVALIYTLLKTGITANRAPTAKRVIVVCPCSLVKNWENEFTKWLGPGGVKCLALAEANRQAVQKNLDVFVKTRMFQILIVSYECLRTHHKRLIKYPDCCDLLVCDEAHRLKNSDNQTSRALNSLPVARRVLLTGTPMQNDLQEFYAMVDFTNPGILGTPEEFRRQRLFPILRGREPDATDAQQEEMRTVQNEMSLICQDFILRRVNTLNAQHLPPKLVQVVCCKLTDIQQNMYQHLVNSKDMQHVLQGKQVNCLGSIQMLMKLANHPSLVVSDDHMATNNGRRGGPKISYSLEEPTAAAPGADGIAKFLPLAPSRRADQAPVFPEWSGKMWVLYRLMREMRKPGNGNDKIVIVSNYTQTLDLIGRMCRENSWGFCRLDGSIGMKKRQAMCDEFNDPTSSLVAFLLSSKAGGCGLNLIGGNRLVLFDPDWNPAVDKQAAARCWRDGQKKRCFTYRFLATGTVEEKIFQRQLSKEGLQSVVDDKEQTNQLSTKDLKNLFKLRTGTPSDTHDKLRCQRCRIIQDQSEQEAKEVLPQKLEACRELLQNVLLTDENAQYFRKPLVPTEHGRTVEEYEKIVKQPMDLGTILSKLENKQAYGSCSAFSKDVNRVFSNVLKVWSPGEAIADAARALQAIWLSAWTELVPRLMTMKLKDPEKDESVEGIDDGGTAMVEDVNERGEDYQEQIGMPDEENMRQWSHHYSTDTVDDPIFRAAMRGCDAVSFVFGLEVTWSLIQQRQQDEEERLAMEEMERCGAVEESDDNDTKPACKIVASESNAPPADSSDEESNDDDLQTTVEPVETVAAKSTEGIGRSSFLEDSSDEDCVGSAHGQRSQESSIAGDHSSVPKVAESSESSSPVAKENAGPKSKTISKAPMFSADSDDESLVAPVFQNKRKREEVMFESSSDDESVLNKRASVMEDSDNESLTPANKAPSNEWECSTCTLLNRQALRSCEACGSKKPRSKG